MVTQAPLHHWDHLICILFVPALIFCVFKAKAYACAPKMIKDGLRLTPFPQHVLGHVINLLCLPFPMRLDLAYGAEREAGPDIWKPRNLDLSLKAQCQVHTAVNQSPQAQVKRPCCTL
jgi:hypothetical protein